MMSPGPWPYWRHFLAHGFLIWFHGPWLRLSFVMPFLCIYALLDRT